MADLQTIHDDDALSASPEPAAPDGILAGEAGLENGTEARPKMRGRDRLLRGLQRMSSSPSLTRPGRQRSASSPYSISGALSCVSLASSASPFGQPSAGSYFSQSSAAGNSSTHTSIPATPITESPVHEEMESALPVRPVGHAGPVSTTASLPLRVKSRTKMFSLWARMPHELKLYILSFLRPKELVRASRVSKDFYHMCFDGQLWTSLDASEFYREIPAESLAKMIVAAGPFVKDLNLRGCLQVEHYQRAEVVVKACRNLMNATLEGCRNFKRSTLHSLLKANSKLTHLNLTGLAAVNNATCKIVANSCPLLEVFNVSWCKHMDARGAKFVVDGCPKLKDLRMGEIKGFNNLDVAEAIFRTNNLERLVLAGCDDLTDTALRTMIHGQDPEIDYLTDRPSVPPRRIRHLDLSRCSRLTNAGVKALGYLVPHLEGLQLSGVTRLGDSALEPILASAPCLTHLELEDLSHLTNSLLSQHLAKAPCAPVLEHLSISYCARLGDAGMLPLMRACTRLESVLMDNTRISDLVLAEAAKMVRARSALRPAAALPRVTLTLVVYDCPLVTWTGVREVLSRNTDVFARHRDWNAKATADDKGKRKEPANNDNSFYGEVINDNNNNASSSSSSSSSSFSSKSLQVTPRNQPTNSNTEVIGLKCFYGWQMTVDEHTKRVLRGDVAAARRLERKWADYMQANEEAEAGGSGGRRRRRRVREAQAAHDEEEGAGGAADDGEEAGAGAGGGTTGRRRARTTVCVVM
ncbi:RNI-like protein [Parathielavia appendiculata]|uniref:RNI-like protein n=1 Tax=Parathielavia appendiculata TaxID=2587402 RepID=A0AAN6TZN7_9PEZI|nr:RNI-like protein [Parathielavia appendiculata]